ncbi:hypothetical protein N658DRAFT_490063 [Parathielavia hyrcaniae]|uniref:Uncharacterized protein n=1 Tax=Parathielavia hyrcaniae TaxID=113614 RepID=A0AAN6PVV0_9PEZI|nr:hypothetical protein N658DRAFT_490063 [Parathielavia hyrcaniae]
MTTPCSQHLHKDMHSLSNSEIRSNKAGNRANSPNRACKSGGFRFQPARLGARNTWWDSLEIRGQVKMPSFTTRRYVPGRFRSANKPDEDLAEDMMQAAPATKDGTSLALGPSDGSLLDYFDLPSPPSTPHRPTHSLGFSSLAGLTSPTSTPALTPRSSPSSLSSLSTSSGGSPTSSPPTTTLPRWPTASQRIHRLPIRPRSRRASSSSSSSSSSSAASASALTPIIVNADVDMLDTSAGVPPQQQPLMEWSSTRRTPYYPPNSSRNVDRARVYMNRGPHYVPNWTPMSSLPRHVQLQIEERMVKFTAI